MSLQYSLAKLTKQGGRDYNEDSFGADKDRGIYVVADGLGGHGGGSEASRIAVKSMMELLSDANFDDVSLQEAIQKTNELILSHQNREPLLAKMRTTLVVLWIRDDKALWGHIGDSRLYLFYKGKRITQTKDHSVPQALVQAGEIELDDIRYHEDRSRLRQALGQESTLNPSVQNVVQLHSGFAFLLVTDGFWEYIWEDEMIVDWCKSKDPEKWLDLMEDRLVRKVETNHDNYTSLAVFVEQEKQETPTKIIS
jgi:serine/threonine protein phosphatase PrpC